MAQQGSALRHLMQSLHRQNILTGGLRECSTSLRAFSAQAAGRHLPGGASYSGHVNCAAHHTIGLVAGPSGEQQSMPNGEDTPPPSAASTVGLMAVGGESPFARQWRLCPHIRCFLLSQHIKHGGLTLVILPGRGVLTPSSCH